MKENGIKNDFLQNLIPCTCMYVYSQVVFPLDGRTWAMAESIEAGELEAVSSPNTLPPTVVSQHVQPPRRLILLTTQVRTVHSMYQ